MDGPISVAVICHGALIREAIIETLEAADIAVAWSSDTLEQHDAESSLADIGIYALSSGDEAHERQEAQRLLALDVTNWIVLCDDKRNALCRALLSSDLPLCTAPLDVTRAELVHLVRLAARNRRMCVDAMCDQCPATIVDPLALMSLSKEHVQLMRYLSDGLSNKEIARLDSCSESLVKVRVRTLLAKLNVQNRTQAAVLAARSGLKHSSCTPV